MSPYLLAPMRTPSCLPCEHPGIFGSNDPQILVIIGDRLPLMAWALAASHDLLDLTQAIDGVDG